jgi:virulence factor Mce-like protein
MPDDRSLEQGAPPQGAEDGSRTGDDMRERMTDGLTRERLKMEGRRAARPLIVLAAGLLVGAGILAWMIPQMSATAGRSTFQVRFEVGDTFGVFPGFDDVRFRGVRAGTITRVDHEGSRLFLVAKIRKRFGPIYRDARAEVRPITPLNDVYMDIVDPGTPKAGEATADEALPRAQTSTSVFVPDVLDGLDVDARLGLHRLVDELGNGLDDGGDGLRRAFVALGPFLRHAGVLTRQLAERDTATRRLVHNTALLTRELGRRQTDLKRLVATGSATLGSLQQSSPDLDATLTRLGPTFMELRSTLAAVRGTVGNITTGLDDLLPVADALPGGLAATRSLSKDLGPAARSLRRPLAGFRPWIAGVDLLARRLTPGLPSLLGEVPTLDRLTRRLVDCEKGVIGFFQWNTSLTKFGDANGPIPRGNLALGAPDLGVPGVPLREPAKACAPGVPVRALATAKDKH